MQKSIAWRAYKKYLHDNGRSNETPKGNRSTTSDYPDRVDRICRKEGFSNWDDFGEHIFGILSKYEKGGTEEEYGQQSHGSNLKALQLFVEFYGCFDADIEQ